MDFSKLKNKLLICLCCIILILPFYLITFCYGFESNVLEGYSAYSGTLHYTGTSNVVYFYPVVGGNTYKLSKNSNFTPSYAGVFFSISIADRSSTSEISTFTDQTSITFICPEDGYILVSSSSELTPDMLSLSTTVIDDTINSLVDNVGINQIWNIFDISINYIVVVVLFAFGCYIIFRIIKKISRGKEGL